MHKNRISDPLFASWLLAALREGAFCTLLLQSRHPTVKLKEEKLWKTLIELIRLEKVQCFVSLADGRLYYHLAGAPARDWYFGFRKGSRFEDHYVIIPGLPTQAELIATHSYGPDWIRLEEAPSCHTWLI